MFILQSLLGRKALEVQLQRIGVFEENNTVAQFEGLEEKFKYCMNPFLNTWFCLISPVSRGLFFRRFRAGWRIKTHWWMLTYSFMLVSICSVWADHGDEISIQYSGTGALKGDFVRCVCMIFSVSHTCRCMSKNFTFLKFIACFWIRYGQRTIRGILQDGYNSAARYYLNNFRDGIKQVWFVGMRSWRYNFFYSTAPDVIVEPRLRPYGWSKTPIN